MIIFLHNCSSGGFEESDEGVEDHPLKLLLLFNTFEYYYVNSKK